MFSSKGIRDRTLKCIESFNKCLVNPALGKLTWVERCQADFNLWTYGLKATTTGRSSLDHRVREHEDVRNVICDLLDGLAELLHSCLEASPEPEEVEDLEFDTRTVLKQLSRIHIAIRRAGNNLRHQRADAALGDALETEDFIEWKEDMENLILMGIENKNQNHGHEKGRNSDCSQQRTLHDVQKRLIRVNLLRRHRIQYTRSALEEAKRKDAERLLEKAKNRVFAQKHAIEPVPPQPHVATAVIEPERLERKDQGPVGSHSNKNPSVSENQQTATDIPSKFELPPSNSRKSGTIITKATRTGREQNYPRWHKDLGAYGDVLCPYCAEPLSRDYINDDVRWRGHLAGDLTPYVCIMDDCKTPDLMFITSEDLNKHILGEHGCCRWVCSYCPNEANGLHREDTFIYDTAEDWVSHVKHDHLPNIPVPQLEELSLLNQRRFIQPMECPLCDVVISTMQAELHEHITGHLHSFALRALPWGLSQGSHESDTPRVSGRIELESSFVSSRWENLSNLSDVEWPDHDKPVIKSWEDWHDMKDEVVIRKISIENWMRDISDFPASEELSDDSGLVPDERKSHRAAFEEVLQEASTYKIGKIGNITGSVNVFTSPERPETPPRPVAIIPFPRDTDFVERGPVLDEVHQRCAMAGSRAALVGLGGVGKSQLAIEYAYRTRERSPETWVLWVHASNAARFEQSYRDIADRVKIFGRQDPKADIIKLVYDWLCSSKDWWLLVLDNVDDARFLLDVPVAQQNETADSRSVTKPLRSYIPHSKHGSVLVTTRNLTVALQLVERHNIFHVEPMNQSQAMMLLKNKLQENEDPISIDELAAVLDYMPLAMVQTAAYISQRRPRYSVQQYLEDFRRSDRKRMALLNSEAGQFRRDYEAKNSIITTWQISFDYIRETRSSAAGLLSLMSFFDRQEIPEKLLRARPGEEPTSQELHECDSKRQAWENEDSASQSSADDDGFENDIQTLRDYSFVSVNADGASFKMHGLVQLAMRTWLQIHDELEQWKQRFVSSLYAAFPTGNYENWAVCQRLFAHAKSAAEQRPEREDSLREWASLLYKAAWYALLVGNWAEAEAMSLQSTKTRRKILGLDHEDTLRSMAILGEVCRSRGQWADAEALEVQVMETRKTKLGADHPDTLVSMDNLAQTYINQGRWADAEALDVQVIETSKTKLGADHPNTLMSMANLASTYRKQGRWADAEALGVQVVETQKTNLGADHPSTLTSMANLALTYREQGRWADAEALEVQVMETRKTKLGADHPDTLVSMDNLAQTYTNQGRWVDAEALGVQVMETSKTKLGADHPDTLTSMNNLAFTFKGLGKVKEAFSLIQDCCRLRDEVLGSHHPHTLLSQATLTAWQQEAIDISE